MESVRHYMEGLQFLINANIRADIFFPVSVELFEKHLQILQHDTTLLCSQHAGFFFTVSFLCSDLL